MATIILHDRRLCWVPVIVLLCYPTRRSYTFRYHSAGHFVEYFRSYYGPTLKAFESLDPDGREALAQDLEKLLEQWNTSGNATIIVSSDYLEVVAVRR